MFGEYAERMSQKLTKKNRVSLSREGGDFSTMTRRSERERKIRPDLDNGKKENWWAAMANLSIALNCQNRRMCISPRISNDGGCPSEYSVLK